MILILPRHCLIYDPDSSPSLLYMILNLPRHALSYIWSWFFLVTVLYVILILPRHCPLYMILNLPRHCLIYDPDSSPSLSYRWSWFFPVMHCLIYDPDSSLSLSYIWQKIIEIFPLFITSSFYRSWDIYILCDNFPQTGKNHDIVVIL
jgi:hypothetical protein